MNSNKRYLRGLLSGESRAYGFTIAFWGSGSLLINAFGVPNFIEAISYGSGAVTGFGLLTLIAFNGTMETVEKTESTWIALSMIHYLAALIPILFSKLIVENFSNSASAFFLAGISVSIVYNSLYILEEDLAEFLA